MAARCSSADGLRGASASQCSATPSSLRRERRLRHGSDFRRVRSRGRSWAHPLLVLVVAAHPDGPEAITRVGFVAGKRVGNAVIRNKARRRVREAVRARYEQLPSGRDLVLILRSSAGAASFETLDQTVVQLLKRAGLLEIRTPECAASPSG